MPDEGSSTRVPSAPRRLHLGLAEAAALLLGTGLLLSLPTLPGAIGFVGLSLLLALLLALLAGVWRRARRTSASGVLPALALALGGFLWAGLHAQLSLSQRLPVERIGQDLRIEGRVLGLVRDGQASTGFDLRIDASEDAPELVGRRVRLGWYGHAPAIAPGETWRLGVRLKRPRGVANRGGADFERRALEQRLAATGYVREPASASRLSPARGLDAWRSATSQRLHDQLPSAGSRFVRGLAVGDTRGLLDRDWDALRATGLTHLMAISGFHVGVVAGFGALLARLAYRILPRLGRRLPRPQGAAVLALALAVAYSAAAGFALPTQRAVLMILAALGATLARRRTSPGQAFALALTGVLVLDPLAVLSAGFWLSFLGVGWLLWCLPGGAPGGVLRALLGAQWVVTLGLLPLTAWFFGQASWVGPLANLVGIPLVTLVVVPLSLLALGLELLSPGLGMGPAQWAAVVAEQAAGWMHALGSRPWAMRHLPTPSGWSLLLAMLGVFWLLLPRGIAGKPLAALLMLPLLWPRPAVLAAGEVELEVLDVGQGLAVVVRTRSHALLFDTGPRYPGGLDMGATAVVPSLRARGARTLDLIVVSHGDSDHAGGLASVRRAYPQAPFTAPAPWLGGPDAPPVDAGAATPCLAGEGWDWDGVRFDFLHPPRHFPDVGNDGGCVLRVEGRHGSALLTGDVGGVIERRLLRLYPDRLDADVLLVGHHGSRNSTSAAFVAAVAPTVALVSSGYRNRFGHPHPLVVERLADGGSDVLDTGREGVLLVHMGTDGVQVGSRRQSHRRVWREPAARRAADEEL